MITAEVVNSVVVLDSIPRKYIPLYTVLEKMVLASSRGDGKETVSLDCDFRRLYNAIYKNDSKIVNSAFNACRKLCLVSIDRSLSQPVRENVVEEVRNTFYGFPIPNLL